MSRSGPKRKDVPREPNGKPQRASTSSESLNARNEADVREQQSVVLAQPHRMGSSHCWRGSALGRFLLDANISDPNLFAGVERYAALKRNWAIAQGAPRGFANSTSRSSGDGPDEETVRGWRARYTAIDEMIRLRHGHSVFATIESVACDDRDINGVLYDDQKRAIVNAMLDVAIEMGTKSARLTPFL